MSEPETDLFGFDRQGFHAGYSRLTRPPTREQKLAALDAQREDVTAAKTAAATSVITGTPTRGTTPTKATENSAKVDEVKAMSKEERDSYMDALFNVQYENGEYETPKPVEDEDEWSGE